MLDNVSVVANGEGGGYLPQTFTFSADGKSTTLTFKDVSTVAQNVDLLLDNVVVTDADRRASPRKFDALIAPESDASPVSCECHRYLLPKIGDCS